MKPKLAVEKRRLVFVEWEDACGPSSGAWEFVRDLTEHAQYRCWSVGWITLESKTHISVSPHFGNIHSPDGEQMLGVMHIPRAMIRKMRTLRVL